MKEISSVGLGSDFDYFRRNNNRMLSRQRRIRSIKVRTLHLVVILAVLSLAGFTAYHTGHFLMSWEKLQVKHFRVSGGPKAGNQDLERLFSRYRVNILGLDLDNLKDAILKSREIKDVSLSRKLPDTIEVKLFMREPVFQVIGPDHIDVIDREGRIIDEIRSPDTGLITLQDVHINDIPRCLEHLKELKKIRSSIEYVGYKHPYGVVLKLKELPEIFYPGEHDYVHKLKRYLKIKQDQLLKKYNIQCVDLRFENRLYLEYQEEVIGEK